MTKRKVCVVVTSRSNYARVKSVLQAIRERNDLDLQLIAGASLLLWRFGKAVDIIAADGFDIARHLYFIVEGETLSTQAKSTGLGVIELATAFEDIKPDVVLTVGDRFETMATAIAASYMNIPLAHLQGGEVSGNIDDSVRHAITKLANLHFATTLKSVQRIIAMGEEEWRVKWTGDPSIDLLVKEDVVLDESLFKKYGGIGLPIDCSKPYIVMVQHPVTTSYGRGFHEVQETLRALRERPEQKIVLWPNIDAGSDDVSKGIRMFREQNMERNYHYYRNFSPEDYGCILSHAVCAVGNSSSFIREGSYLGVPAVIAGDRQRGRECGSNVLFVNYDHKEIGQALDQQIRHGRYASIDLYGDGKAGQKIAEYLATLSFTIFKRMTY